MPPAPLPIPFAALETARDRLRGLVTRTPLVASPSLGARTGAAVWLKLESLQPTGAFKLRGATNRLAALTDQERRRGVVAVSTGNHGRGVAYAARRLGVRAVICLSELVPPGKVKAITDLGAEVQIAGADQEAAEQAAHRLVADQGLTFVSPFDDPHVIAGQGTIAFELIADLPAPDLVLVPLSGGGLICGIALGLAVLAPNARVIGVSMDRGAAMHASLAAGRPVPVEERPTLADALGGGIGLDNRYTFDLVRRLVDDVVLVTEDEIAAALAHSFRCDRQIAEGAAVVGQAALLAGKVRPPPGAQVVCLLGGNSIDLDRLIEIVREHRL